MSRQAMKGWGANLGADLRARKDPCWMALQTGRACLLTTGLGDMPSRPRSWTFIRVRSCFGNVEGARTGSLRVMRTR
uniref:Uncharacterized protein n=1 Tax=Aegilops tauschii subsp. strangulata TaxID=200361 RepID=A0A453DUQ9_AEGTS